MTIAKRDMNLRGCGLWFRGLATLTLILIGSVACCGAETKKAAAGLAEKDYREFAERMERAATANVKEFVQSINADALLDRALQGLPGSDKEKNGFRAGFKARFDTTMASSFAAVSDYKLLRLSSTNGEWQAVFRVLLEEGGLNYHTLALAPGPRGHVQIVDINIAIMGEWMSASMRRVALPLLAESEKGIVERLVGTESDMVKHRKVWSELLQKSKQGESEKVMALYRQLPDSLQREKFILVHRLKASQAISDAEYEKTILFWAQSHPRDISLPLISIDAYAMKKQYPKLLAALDRVDANVGGDPYLNVLRAYQYLEMHQPDKGREAIEKTLKAEPKLASAYDCALALALDRKDFKELGRLLTEAEKNLAVNLVEMVDGSEDYAAFRKTDTYRDWKGSHAATAKAQ